MALDDISHVAPMPRYRVAESYRFACGRVQQGSSSSNRKQKETLAASGYAPATPLVS